MSQWLATTDASIDEVAPFSRLYQPGAALAAAHEQA